SPSNFTVIFSRRSAGAASPPRSATSTFHSPCIFSRSFFAASLGGSAAMRSTTMTSDAKPLRMTSPRFVPPKTRRLLLVLTLEDDQNHLRQLGFESGGPVPAAAKADPQAVAFEFVNPFDFPSGRG